MSDTAYLSFLATDDFLPGVCVLAHSLRKTGTDKPLVVLVTKNVREESRDTLRARGIGVEVVEPIPFPEGMEVREERWRNNYSKLRIFNQTRFRKAVYLDADTVVCASLDELFERPHMSAVNAGGAVPRHADWTGFNSGLLVIEPDADLFQRMMSKVGKLEGRGHGDQGFLNSFYPDWANQRHLHLPDVFNQLHLFLDDYWWHFGYKVMKGVRPTERELGNPKLVRMIHYISHEKPWLDLEATRRLARRKRWTRPQMSRSLRLWLELHEEAFG